MAEDEELTLREHLEELRVRLVWSVLGIAIATGISFFFISKDLADFMESNTPGDTTFIFTTITEAWTTYLKLAFYCGVAITLPFLLYQAVMFVRPGLTRKEAMYTYISLPFVALLFASGVGFTYFIFLPNALEFLIESEYLGSTMGTPMLTVGEYLSDITKILFGMGLMFETPLVMFLLTKLGLVTPGGLLRKWRYAIVGAFIAAALITPTWDPINCSIVAAPLIVLYFLGVLLSWVAGGSKQKEDDLSVVVEEG